MGKDSYKINFWFFLVQAVTGIFGCIGIGYMSTILTEFGYSTLVVGRAVGISLLFAMITRSLWGIINDRYDSTKQVMLLGVGLCGIFFFILTHSTNIYIRFACVILAQMSFAGMYNVVDAWSIKLRREGYKIVYGVTRIGCSVFYGVCGVVFGAIATRYGYKPGNYILWISYLVLIFAVLHIPNPALEITHTKKNVTFKKGINLLIHTRVYMLMLLAYFLCSIGNSCAEFFTGPYILSLGGTEGIVGATLGGLAFSEIPIMLGYAAFRRKTGIKPSVLMAFSFYFFSVRALFGAFTTNPYMLVVAAFSQSLAYGLFLPSCLDFMDEIINKDYLSTATLVFFAVGSTVGMSVGNLIWGVVLDNYGYNTAFKIAAIIIFIASFIGTFASIIYEKGLKNQVVI